jgi:hypothetical protein
VEGPTVAFSPEPDWLRTAPAEVPSTPEDSEGIDASHIEILPGRDRAEPSNIADHYRDLLALVSKRKRLGIIAQLSVGFYEGWRPSRAEVADLIALDLGLMTVDEAHERVRKRRQHVFVPDISPVILSNVAVGGSSTKWREQQSGP